MNPIFTKVAEVPAGEFPSAGEMDVLYAFALPVGELAVYANSALREEIACRFFYDSPVDGRMFCHNMDIFTDNLNPHQAIVRLQHRLDV